VSFAGLSVVVEDRDRLVDGKRGAAPSESAPLCIVQLVSVEEVLDQDCSNVGPCRGQP
jgi:hypothetical protein